MAAMNYRASAGASKIADRKLGTLKRVLAASTDRSPVPCGGCGATRSADRCIGCLHDFKEGAAESMKVYAVKMPGSQEWYIATKMKASEYGGPRGLIADNPDCDVWSEVKTTAFLGHVGNGEETVLLDDQ